MTPEVKEAVEEVRRFFGEIEVKDVSQGGALVVVKEVFLGDQYAPSKSWIGFVIGFQYPRADVYPHFVTHELKRVDGKSLGSGFSAPVVWDEKQSTQISRRSNRLDPSVDTAATKLAKVLKWINDR